MIMCGVLLLDDIMNTKDSGFLHNVFRASSNALSQSIWRQAPISVNVWQSTVPITLCPVSQVQIFDGNSQKIFYLLPHFSCNSKCCI